MSPENNYGKPSISRLDYIERIQHDVQDDFTKQVADLKAENARLVAETTRLLDALIAAEYILGRVETITLKGDENPPKYHWGEAADLVHSTLVQHQLEMGEK